MRAHVHPLGQRLGHNLPTPGTALRRFELARVRHMQARTSLYRFVREHLMRHTQPRRKNLSVEAGFLLDHSPRLFQRAFGRTTHVLGLQFFGSDDGAGGGAGLDGERSGLWREMARIIGEVRPRFVRIENSPALVTRGLDRVLADLAAMGFACRWGVVGADDVGAMHIRKRLWILGCRQW